MKIFQLKLSCHNKLILKKSLLGILLLCGLFNLNAQERNHLKLGIEAGGLPSPSSENLGIFLNVEPKLRISENTFFGLRIGIIINSHSVDNFDISQFGIDDRSDNGGISLVPTLDYYLNENNFRPYLGFGLGPYLLTNYLDVFSYASQSGFEVYVKNQFGLLLRGGWESDKLRLGLEYNFISKANIEVPNDQIIGPVDNSYFGLSVGFTIRGGKRSRS